MMPKNITHLLRESRDDEKLRRNAIPKSHPWMAYLSPEETCESEESGLWSAYNRLTTILEEKINPTGQHVTLTVPKECSYYDSSAMTWLTEGQSIPAIGTKDVLETPHYIYKYDKTIDGWHVKWRIPKYPAKYPDAMPDLYSTINGKSLKSMNSAFIDCKLLKTAPKIPETVIDLDYAFKGCGDLTCAPVLPSCAETMNHTFDGCSSLRRAPKIPDGVKTMNYAFSDCGNLEEIDKIPSSVTELAYAFGSCYKLKRPPILSEGVKFMYRTFMHCTSLEEAPKIPTTVESMAETFCGCNKMRKAPRIPERVFLLTRVFAGCSSMSGSITIDAQKYNNEMCIYGMLNGINNPIFLTGSCPFLLKIVELSDALDATISTSRT